MLSSQEASLLESLHGRLHNDLERAKREQATAHGVVRLLMVEWFPVLYDLVAVKMIASIASRVLASNVGSAK